MPRAWARAWAASCRRVPRTSSRGAAQSFAADHDFGVLLACDVPPAGGVVAPAGVLAVGAAGDDDDGRRGFPGASGGFPARCLPGPSGSGWRPGSVARLTVGAVPVAGPVYRDHSSSPKVGAAGAVEPVVAAAPVGVGEGVVGFGDLPEPLSGVGAVVDVRVVLLGQLAVGRLDLRHGGVRARRRAARSSRPSWWRS